MAVKQAKEAAADIRVAYKTQLSANNLLQNNYIAQLKSIDSLLQSTTDSLVTVPALANQSAIITQLEVLKQQQENLLQIIDAEQDSKAELVKAQNANLPETTQIEYNQKVVNEIELSVIAKDNLSSTAPNLGFTSTQIATLHTIAHQCPYLGGDAVFSARSIYRLFSDDTYDDYAICAAVGIQARQIKPKTTEKTVKDFVLVYPNPAATLLNIMVPETYIGATIELYSVLGQKVMQGNITNQNQTINVEDLNSGTYFLKVIQSDKSYQQKINIIK